MRSIALGLALSLACACGGDDGGGGEPSSDATSGDEDAAAGAPDGGASPTCEAYCALIAEACVERMRQYRELETCLSTCALFPPGEPGEETGNSLSCRIHHAELARGEPEPHCYHAGPSGGHPGVCGTACQSYCTIVMPACPDLYRDEAECLDVCGGFADPRPYTIFESRSDTVACRTFHGTLATADDGHCGTASAGSGACIE